MCESVTRGRRPWDEEMAAVLNASAVVELKEEEREAAKAMFQKMDVDGSGKLEMAEMHSVLQKLGLDIPSEQFELYAGAILTNYDRNIKDFALDFKEFTKFYSKCLASEGVRKRYAGKLVKSVGGPAMKASAQAAFDKYDKDESGSIDAKELRALLTDVLKLELTEEQWARARPFTPPPHVQAAFARLLSSCIARRRLKPTTYSPTSR